MNFRDFSMNFVIFDEFHIVGKEITPHARLMSVIFTRNNSAIEGKTYTALQCYLSRVFCSIFCTNDCRALLLFSCFSCFWLSRNTCFLDLKEMSQGSKSHSAPSMPKYFNYFPYFHEWNCNVMNTIVGHVIAEFYYNVYRYTRAHV
jgi:hypothetical protein